MSGWQNVSADPNSAQAQAYRNHILDQAKRPSIVSRNEYLADLARGKRVLDVGVVAHVTNARLGASWLHREIVKAAKTCLGVDILDEGIAQLKADGFNVHKADITRDVIEGEYDLMVCGEIIEHLGDPGALFQAAQRVLVPGGCLVITSPNPYCLGRVWSYVRGRHQDSVDHALLLGPSNVAELADRGGLQLVSYRGVTVGGGQARTVVGKVTFWARPLLLCAGVAPEAFCETLVYECVKY